MMGTAGASTVWLMQAVTHTRDPLHSSPPMAPTSSSRPRITDREPALQMLPPAPLGPGAGAAARAPQSTYIQTLTRQQIIASELYVLVLDNVLS